MPIGKIQPPSAHPEEEPTVCIAINEEWVSYLIGMVYPARYPEYWAGTLEENRTARADVLTLMSLLAGSEDCGNMVTKCCVEPRVIKRVDPITGLFQQSTNDGATWEGVGGGMDTVITEPVPPVTNGIAATKCDAASNVREQVQGWVTQVSNDFDTATSLLEFAEALILAIAGAVLTILTEGGFAPIEAALIAALGAAITAAWGAGKVVFDAYWTSANIDIVLCAAFCNIGDDGSYTDAQFSSFWNDCNSDLAPSPAKMLFMGFLSSVGRQGLNAMAASGKSADSDCTDCDCGVCEVAWAKGNIDGNTAFGTVTSLGAGLYRVQSQLHTDGVYYAEMVTPSASECCHVVSIVANTGGSMPSTGTAAARIVCPNDQHVGNVTSGDMITSDTNFNYIAWNSGNAFDILIQFD